MTAFYILNEEGRCTSVVNGDTQTMLLNIPQESTYTIQEPENVFEQVFDVATQKWIYPSVNDPESLT